MEALFGGAAPPTHRSLARLEVENRLPHGTNLFVLTELSNGVLTITASDGVSTWGGRLVHSQLKELATRVKMSVEEFTTESVKALSRENLGSLEFAYSVKVNPSGSLEVVWKRHLIADNIKYQLGEVVLDPRPAGQVHSLMLEHSITDITSLHEKVADLQAESGRLVSERQAALSRLERCVEIKEEVEAELYEKFKLVLNEKKAKIRRLMEQLSSVSEGTRGVVATPPEQDEGQSGSETDDGIPAGESPQRDATPLREVESLLGGVAEVVSPPVKRRRRQGTARPTGQPEIPRPPSITRPSSSKIKVHSVSSESADRRSEDSLESDDLLNLL